MIRIFKSENWVFVNIYMLMCVNLVGFLKKKKQFYLVFWLNIPTNCFEGIFIFVVSSIKHTTSWLTQARSSHHDDRGRIPLCASINLNLNDLHESLSFSYRQSLFSASVGPYLSFKNACYYLSLQNGEISPQCEQLNCTHSRIQINTKEFGLDIKIDYSRLQMVWYSQSNVIESHKLNNSSWFLIRDNSQSCISKMHNHPNMYCLM